MKPLSLRCIHFTFEKDEPRSMKISYDPEIDALYIRLLDDRHECRSVRLSDEVALNIGTGEKLVGIEILDATAVLGIDKTPAVTLEGLEAAASPLVVRDKPAKKYKA
jgi:uncharacterized protein YuzE